MDWNIALWIMIGLSIIFIFGTFLTKPLLFIGRLLVSIVVGIGLLLLTNVLLGKLGISVAINVVTVLTAGILHVPGVVLLVALEKLFV